jgi:quercetin dioxygenase-like cupin family protein
MSQQPDAYSIATKETILATPKARVTLMTLTPGQSVPPHSHTTVTDTTFCLSGLAEITLCDPTERLRLTAGDRATVHPGRVHGVANIGTISCRLLLIQGPGTYDFTPAS